MPLINSKDNQWNGYLVDDLAGATESFMQDFEARLRARNLSKVTWNRTTVNMWWTKQSPCMDIVSNVDDTVGSTVHVMDYGTALFIGIAFTGSWLTDNYYKRMAAACFLETIDRCVCEAVKVTSDKLQKEAPKLTTIGKAGKFGG